MEGKTKSGDTSKYSNTSLLRISFPFPRLFCSSSRPARSNQSLVTVTRDPGQVGLGGGGKCARSGSMAVWTLGTAPHPPAMVWCV